MDTAPSEDGLINVVKVVHWRRCAEEKIDEKIYYGDIYGTMACSSPDIMAFKPYNELTFDEVCNWLESNMDVNKIDETIDQQIENQKNPPIVQLPLPWQQQDVKIDNVEENI